jgi:hypothetical protein
MSEGHGMSADLANEMRVSEAVTSRAAGDVEGGF